MANSGINKAQVKKARAALLIRGTHPSIDAVRVELGNTGSKTTIARYLRELQDEETQKLGNTNAVSEALIGMVADLATYLQQEAQALVTQAKETADADMARLKNLLTEREQQLSQSQDKCRTLESALANAEQTCGTLKITERELIVTVERQAQQLATQASLIEQKDTHIQSLEEKHQHARESLEHYRQSVKDQREQEQRRHEHQVQQLQAELRQLGQTLSIKQNDITQLTKDNARLAAEVAELGKQLRAKNHQAQTLTTSLKTSESALAIANSKLEQTQYQYEAKVTETDRMKEDLAALRQMSEALRVELAGVKAELTVRNELSETLRQAGFTQKI